MAANREAQGLQIALIVFVMCTVVLGLMTFVFFNQSNEATTIAKNANEAQKKADDSLRSVILDVEKLKILIGQKPDVKVDVVTTDFEADMAKYGATIPPDKKNYRQALEFFKTTYDAANVERAVLKEEVDKLKTHIATYEAGKEQEIVALKAAETKSVAELAAARAQFNEELAAKVREKQELEDKNKNVLDEAATIKEEAKKEQDRLVKEVVKLQEKIRVLTDELAKYRKTDFIVGYGAISLVNQRNRTVWINLGRADELRSGVSFSVKAANQGTESGEATKGRIEVTEILGPHLAEARILEDSLVHPLVPGDQIYTSLWHPGIHEHYAIGGFIDLDNDGNDDRDIIRDLITQAGGIIDAEADGEKRVGAMTVNTRFVIVGTPPREKGQSIYSDLLSEADKLKIDRISVEKFLDRAGWKDPQQVMRYGRYGNASKMVPPRPDGGVPYSKTGVSDFVKPEFQKRRPPANTQPTGKPVTVY
jgi:hypothetical protein